MTIEPSRASISGSLRTTIKTILKIRQNKSTSKCAPLIDEAHKRAIKILEEKNRDKVQLMADMLMEFETLDSTDIGKIKENSWNIDDKRQRPQDADDLQRKQPPPPPTDIPKRPPIGGSRMSTPPPSKKQGLRPSNPPKGQALCIPN